MVLPTDGARTLCRWSYGLGAGCMYKALPAVDNAEPEILVGAYGLTGIVEALVRPS